MIDYYENAAREVGLLPKDFPSSTDTSSFKYRSPVELNALDQSEQLKVLTKGVPGKEDRENGKTDPVLLASPTMPFPAHVAGLPPPPPSFYVKSSSTRAGINRTSASSVHLPYNKFGQSPGPSNPHYGTQFNPQSNAQFNTPSIPTGPSRMGFY